MCACVTTHQPSVRFNLIRKWEIDTLVFLLANALSADTVSFLSSSSSFRVHRVLKHDTWFVHQIYRFLFRGDSLLLALPLLLLLSSSFGGGIVSRLPVFERMSNDAFKKFYFAVVKHLWWRYFNDDDWRLTVSILLATRSPALFVRALFRLPFSLSLPLLLLLLSVFPHPSSMPAFNVLASLHTCMCCVFFNTLNRWIHIIYQNMRAH